MYDKEITYKPEWLEVIEALDKLGKNYVITKGKKEMKADGYPSYTTTVWHVKEV